MFNVLNKETNNAATAQGSSNYSSHILLNLLIYIYIYIYIYGDSISHDVQVTGEEPACRLFGLDAARKVGDRSIFCSC